MAEAQRNPDRNSWGRRCDMGCESWPDTTDFATCLRCGGATTRYSNLQPMDFDEAISLLRHARFNRYYEKHCERLKIPFKGPLK